MPTNKNGLQITLEDISIYLEARRNPIICNVCNVASNVTALGNCSNCGKSLIPIIREMRNKKRKNNNATE